MLNNLKLLSIGGYALKQLKVNGIQVWIAPVSYTNQVPISIDTDGSIFNDIGWIGGYRVRSTGGLAEAEYTATTGYIPVSAGDIIRFKISQYGSWDEVHAGNCMCYCSEDFTALGSFTQQPAYYGICTAANSVITEADGIYSFIVPDNPDICYLRMSVRGTMADGSHGASLIVAANESIK